MVFEELLAGIDTAAIMTVVTNPIFIAIIFACTTIVFGGGLAFLLLNPTIRCLALVVFSGQTWIQYERSNGTVRNAKGKLEDGCYDDPNIGIILQTPNSVKTLEGGIRTVHVYEGLAATIPSNFVQAAIKSTKAGYVTVSQMLDQQNKAIQNKDTKAWGLLQQVMEAVDFSVIRNFFLFSLSPRGIKATISRRVTIELQKERNPLNLLENPMLWIMVLAALVLIPTVVYPAMTNQASVTECQSKLTGCYASCVTKSGTVQGNPTGGIITTAGGSG